MIYGRVYKIVNDVDDQIYVGSTVQALSMRMSGHRRDSKKSTKESKLYLFMRSAGVNHFKAVLLEEDEFKSKEELRAREHYWIQELRPELNCKGAYLNKEQKRESQHKWGKDNPEKLREAKQKWAKNNPSKVREAHRKYRNNNRDKVNIGNRERYRRFYQRRKLQIQENLSNLQALPFYEA